MYASIWWTVINFPMVSILGGSTVIVCNLWCFALIMFLKLISTYHMHTNFWDVNFEGCEDSAMSCTRFQIFMDSLEIQKYTEF